MHRFVVGDHEIRAADTGPTAGRTFLLVHGIGMGIPFFAGLSDALQDYGRVVSIDLPGFGETPEPAQALTMAQMGALLIDFTEAENLGGAVLVGHSMGTQVVAEAAAQRPDLFPELVLVAPTVNKSERTMGKQAWRMVQDLLGESPKVVFVGLQNYSRVGPRWFVKKLRNMLAHPVEQTLPRIKAHTLVIRGSADTVCPRTWVEEVTGLIPGATMIEIPGRRHETMIKDPTSVAESILSHVHAR